MAGRISPFQDAAGTGEVAEIGGFFTLFTEAAFFFGECLERGLKILCRFLRAVLGEVEFGPERKGAGTGSLDPDGLVEEAEGGFRIGLFVKAAEAEAGFADEVFARAFCGELIMFAGGFSFVRLFQ